MFCCPEEGSPRDRDPFNAIVVLSPIGYVHAGPCPYPTPAGVTCPHDTPLWCGNLSATGRPGCARHGDRGRC